jgi:hypothetical protein
MVLSLSFWDPISSAEVVHQLWSFSVKFNKLKNKPNKYMKKLKRSETIDIIEENMLTLQASPASPEV